MVKREMSYQVDYPAVLKANFIPFDPVMYLIFIGFPVCLLILFAFRKRMSDRLGYGWIALLLAAFMPLLLVFLMDISVVGSGWRLEDGKLIVKTFAGSKTMDIHGINVALEGKSSSWRPVGRENGYGAPGLGTGWFRLENGKKAIVFRHLNSPQMVVLEYNNSYYVISHPGVEELYWRLVDLGAQKDGAGWRG